jgi:integrase
LEQGSVKNQHEAAFAAIEKPAREECKKAGRAESEAKILRPFPPYCLRHTALTNLAPLCDTVTLKTIAGHSQISMTARYVHP